MYAGFGSFIRRLGLSVEGAPLYEDDLERFFYSVIMFAGPSTILPACDS